MSANNSELIIDTKSYDIGFSNSEVLSVGVPTPENLHVESILSSTSIALDWDDPSLLYDSFTVYVEEVSTGSVVQTIEDIQLSEADVMGLTEGTEYEFWVTATTDGEEGDESNHVTATPEDVTAPAAPTGLTSTNIAETEIVLDWDDNSESDLSGYNVYVDGVKDNSSLVGTSDYTVTGLDSDTQYDFYVTAVDDAGNESDSSSTLTETTAAGAATNQFSIENNGGYIDLGIPPAWEVDVLTTFTVEIWVYLGANISDFMQLFGRASFDFNDNFRLFTSGGTNLRTYLDTVDGASSGTNLFDSLPLNTWQHIAVTYDGLAVTGYQDGIEKATDSSYQGQLAAAASTPWYLGKRHGSNSYEWWWRGNYDELRVWDHIRTQTEIQNNMNSRIDPASAGLVGYYPMDDDSDTSVLVEQSGNALNGSINSGPFYSTNKPFDN